MINIFWAFVRLMINKIILSECFRVVLQFLQYPSGIFSVSDTWPCDTLECLSIKVYAFWHQRVQSICKEEVVRYMCKEKVRACLETGNVGNIRNISCKILCLPKFGCQTLKLTYETASQLLRRRRYLFIAHLSIHSMAIYT